jgi:hypothetical protein
MRTLSGLGAGGAIVAIWERIPNYVKLPVAFGLGLLAASELTIDANHALWSGRIFMGQAAQGEAQQADPGKTRADMTAGAPVTGAAALIATQVDQGDADAAISTARPFSAAPAVTARCSS